MRNIQLSETKVACSHCHQKGYFTCTPQYDANYNTCPLCFSPDFIDGYNSFRCGVEFFENVLQNCHGNRELYKLCPECKIVYKLDESYHNKMNENATLISKWEYDGVNYTGMPQFDTIEEWFDKINDVIVLETICPSENNVCSQYNNNISYCSLYKTD